MDIFERVKMLAKRKNKSLPEVESELGFSSGSLYPHTKNATIRVDRVVSLADYFNVSTDWLLTGNEYSERLSFDEWDLINLYRMMDADHKKSFVQYGAFLAHESLESSKKYSQSDSVEIAE